MARRDWHLPCKEEDGWIREIPGPGIPGFDSHKALALVILTNFPTPIKLAFNGEEMSKAIWRIRHTTPDSQVI